MRIIMVHPHDIYSAVEPWTIRIKSLAGELVKRGNSVKLIYFPLSDKNLDIHFLNGYEAIPFSRYPSPKVFINNILQLIKLARWADIVPFQNCHHSASITAAVSAYCAKKPLHYDWDDWEEKIWYESCGRGLHSIFVGVSFKVLERWLPILADSVSCASSYLKNLAYKFGVKRKYVFDSPVGADLEKFKPNLDGSWVREKYNIKGDLVLYIGQLHGAQYVSLFIKAANIVLNKYPHIIFMIVGEGFLEYKLKKLTYDLGLEDKIIFTGAIRHNDIPYYISAAGICVAPFKDTQASRCKSPLKIVEYLASGKPIVASLVGEVRNMLGGVGVLVKPGDYHSLAEGILRLLRDQVLREKLAYYARMRAERKYNWHYTTDSLLCAYGKILK